jgi:hypothetical protein
VKLFQARTRPCLTRAVGSPSPDFGRPTPRVDRATRYTIVQLLAPTTSLTSREAPRLTGLSYPAVVRPGSSPPPSFPACARGSTNSGHPRRRPAHPHDRRNLPYVVDHFTGAISPPVSPAALFSVAGTVPIGEGPWVIFRVTPGGFLHCQRLDGIVTQGPICKERRKSIPGTLAQSGFCFSI